jgi:hypothetical protein
MYQGIREMWSNNFLTMFEAHTSFLPSIFEFAVFRGTFQYFFRYCEIVSFDVLKSFFGIRFEVKGINFGFLDNFLTIHPFFLNWLT